MAKSKTPYQRIMKAAKEGRGVNLSAEEVFNMSMDHAIYEAAANDDETDAGRCTDMWHERRPTERTGDKCPSCGEPK